jgi:hypothetical protein
MRRLYVVALVALSVVGVLGNAGSAQAAPGDPFQYRKSFGDELNVQIQGVDVNRQTGTVLVSGEGSTYLFDADGNPIDFTAVGAPQVPGSGRVEIDNFGGSTQGDFYIWEGQTFRAYKADGSPIGTGSNGPGWYDPLAEASFIGEACGGGVAPNGNLWLVGTQGQTREVTPSGAPVGQYVKLDISPGARPDYPCRLAFDGAGNAYTVAEGNVFENIPIAIYRYDVGASFARVQKIVPSLKFHDFDIDLSTNDLLLTEDTESLPPVIPTGGWVRRLAYTDPPASVTPTDLVLGSRGLLTARLTALSGDGQTVYVVDVSDGQRVRIFHREPAAPPKELGPLTVKEVRSRGIVLASSLVPNVSDATYRFEYGPDTSYGMTTQPVGVSPFYYSVRVTGALAEVLEPGRTYHVRLAATDSAGTTYGEDRTFTTYPAAPGGGLDPCSNALARKETKAQALPDCRAYELVSSADTGGYDVESYLAPGQTPFPGFPMATDKLLYATHSGAVPGPWHATNKGPDPYLANRTTSGWVTNYEGLPSDLNPEAGSFSSVLGEPDSQLNTLAFAGANLCDPCFTNGGLRTGLPLRLADGQLVQGMSGSLAGSVPNTAKPEGKVAKLFSADGEHLIFASKYGFEPGANTGGDLTVYDRNLATGTTQIASTDQSGKPLTGAVSELDVSADGSRVLTATKTGEDAQGNEYVDPWMHLGSSPNGVNLAPGTTTGVLYAGMSADGSKVFFTTKDKLEAADTDASADLYEAVIDGSGNLTLNLVSETNSDACSPVANTNGEHWNTGIATADCSAVAISGGGGVASASGAIYFLSPESFGGKGTLDQPNLYLAQPGGSPSFVATLEPNNPLVLDSVRASAVRRTGDFQTTPSGGYAAFVSDLALSGNNTFGFATVFRFDAASGQVGCLACDRTETGEPGLAAASELPPNGLGLLDDGRVFFTTSAQLALNDANGRKDVYVSSGAAPILISGGSGPFDSALLTVANGGTDVFFFTHDVLAPEEDTNGQLVKVYDARVGGGFFKLPANVSCQAADECHGPGTPAGSAPDIRSSGKTTQGNVLVCPKNRVKKRGQCVKKPVQRKNKKHAKKKGGAKKRNAAATGKRGGRNA